MMRLCTNLNSGPARREISCGNYLLSPQSSENLSDPLEVYLALEVSEVRSLLWKSLEASEIVSSKPRLLLYRSTRVEQNESHFTSCNYTLINLSHGFDVAGDLRAGICSFLFYAVPMLTIRFGQFRASRHIVVHN
jgi:hypothetical protein